MAIELAASRVLAPYAGTSLRVWTGMLGVVLASLSAGYWWGGRIADRRPDARLLSLLVFGAAVCVGITVVAKDRILSVLQARIEDPGMFALCASLALLTPANVALGMVSPLAARLTIRDTESAGTAVGTLYALSALGSIAGTFLAGFVLIPALGCARLLLATSAALGALSLAISFSRRAGARAAALLVLLAAGRAVPGGVRAGVIFDADTPYNRIWVCRDSHEETGRPMLTLSTDPYGQESAVYLDGDDLVFDYMKFFRLAERFAPGFERALMIGGAAYAYPREFLRRYPGARIDVVEIDPMLTEISRRYFGLGNDPRMTIAHADGRTFLNRDGARYDVIIVDAFKDANCIPFELTTIEAVRRMRARLTDGGVVLVNIIGAVEGDDGRFSRAEYATYAELFPRVMLFPVDEPDDGRAVQNIVLAAADRCPSAGAADEEMGRFLGHLWKGKVPRDVPVLTDDLAPVERYLARVR